MSHVADVQIQILDLDALKTAVEAAGCEFREGQTRHRWYGVRIGGRDTRPGARPSSTYGQCLHAIHIPGLNYEIGVVAHKSGRGFDLAYDDFGADKGRHDGRLIAQKFGGSDLPLLKQGVATAVSRRELARKGYRIQEIRQPNGSIVLKASRS